ncbi:MAG: hypothetical protein ACFE8E_01265 [Candidatus Hodarchaeota archaeon]
MPKCPYCDGEVHIDSYYTKMTLGSFKLESPSMERIGNETRSLFMFFCPHCDRILGFSAFKKGEKF